MCNQKCHLKRAKQRTKKCRKYDIKTIYLLKMTSIKKTLLKHFKRDSKSNYNLISTWQIQCFFMYGQSQ